VSAPDYLWPARPEYLRRGTPLRWLTGDGEYGRPGDLHLYCEQRGVPGDAVMRLCALDLRDVTARAHAAMAWTMIRNSDRLVGFSSAMPDISVMDCGMWLRARQMLRVLVRMRSMDESVTVDEAREALAWAERVAGVAP
jgi:hypothetical protein